MDSMVRRDDARRDVSNSPIQAGFCPPPSAALEAWIAARIPFGAATVQAVMEVPQVRDAEPEPEPAATGRPTRDLPLAMDAAYMVDIEGKSAVDVGDYLGLATWPSESRSVRRYLADGRAALGRRGAWPWALVPDGRLPRQWWCEEGFHRALVAWCDRESAKSQHAAFQAFAAARRTRRWLRVDADR